MDEARTVREYWFGTVPLTAEALDQRMSQFWFGGPGVEQDEEIRARFGSLVERAAARELAGWADGPRRRLSLILLLDQFPRNIYRGTARAFEGDEQALALTLSGMQSGADGALDPPERLFFYMPLQHAENLEAQDEALAACRRLLSEVPADLQPIFARTLCAAQQHHAIVERFGRFPHRNHALGRESTAEEAQWLREGGASFGQ